MTIEIMNKVKPKQEEQELLRIRNCPVPTADIQDVKGTKLSGYVKRKKEKQIIYSLQG